MKAEKRLKTVSTSQMPATDVEKAIDVYLAFAKEEMAEQINPITFWVFFYVNDIRLIYNLSQKRIRDGMSSVNLQFKSFQFQRHLRPRKGSSVMLASLPRNAAVE
jgi:hypothetical protein